MKINRLHRWALFASAAAFIAAAPAHAATVSSTNGDLFLGFRVSGGVGSTHSYLIDIGQASLFTSSFTLSIGNIGTDLDAIFGLGAGNAIAWYDRADLTWGLVGAITPALGSDPNNTQYASKGESVFGTAETPWSRRTNSAQTTTTSKVQTLMSGYNGLTSTTNSSVAVDQTGTNSWSSFFPGGSNYSGGVSFGVYTSALEGSFANGTAGAALDLFRMQVQTTTGQVGTLQGTFKIDNSGTTTFTAVPEPASLTMLGMGVCLLGFVRRRPAVHA
jgi:hypothetical protein